MAEWLDTVCRPFDYGILEAIHNFAMATNGFFTPLMYVISVFAHQAIGMFLLGLVLLCFRRTRKIGLCVFLAVCCGAVFTNLILKNLVARPRPYTQEASALYEWWVFVGAPTESDLSFPSGHATATAAAMTGLFLSTKKRYSFPALFFIALMCISRMYLVVHYPTDVIAGVVSGVLAAAVSFFLTKVLWNFLLCHTQSRLVAFVLHFDPIEAVRDRKRGSAGK